MSRHVKTIPIGIDLGTTYSCVAAWFDEHNRVEIFANEQGNKITPSCVACNDTEVLVGEGAKNQITANPTNTIFGICIPRVAAGRGHLVVEWLSSRKNIDIIEYWDETSTVHVEYICGLHLYSNHM
ncbi:hypothetical protein R6Q59_019641 [Mikania micrantha]